MTIKISDPSVIAVLRTYKKIFKNPLRELTTLLGKEYSNSEPWAILEALQIFSDALLLPESPTLTREASSVYVSAGHEKDFTHTKIHRVTFGIWECEVLYGNWRDMLRSVCEILWLEYKEEFKKRALLFYGEYRSYFSEDKNQLTNAGCVGKNIWVEMNLSANNCASLAESLGYVFGYTPVQFQVS